MTERPWPPGADLPPPVIPLERTLEGVLDLDWVSLDEELAHARFAVRDTLKQPFGLLHGGIFSAVAETLASVATAAAVWRDGCTASGMSNYASFLRPATRGTLDARCRRVSCDDDRWVWSTDFTDEDGRLCAFVEVTIAVRPLPPRE